MTDPTHAPLDPELRRRLELLGEEGWEIWARFDREVREHRWHSFVPAEYGRVLDALLPFRAPGRRFLELGSATGVITIMADLLGFDACGIELDPSLVRMAEELARRHGSGARFAAGSFLPAGYAYHPKDGDGRLGTVGVGESGYLKLGRPLEDFEVVYGYPWTGEESLMHDLMRRYGSTDAVLLLHRVSGAVEAYRGGRRLGGDGGAPQGDRGAPRLHR
ncbi:MAG TPA: hypothetical protein VLH75_06435 [Longimicrobiales bacterium]|nr:hypothetical protein [Longimicrobiales bacterium]